jgi:plasmid stability protein
VAQLVVRELENDVKSRLQRRARQHGRSMEEEVRTILRNAVATEGRVLRNLGSRIAERFRDHGLAIDLPELRGQAPRPATFDTPAPTRRRTR